MCHGHTGQLFFLFAWNKQDFTLFNHLKLLIFSKYVHANEFSVSSDAKIQKKKRTVFFGELLN